MAKQTFTTGQVLTAAQMTSLQQTAMGGGSATAKTASYVLVAADAGTTVAMNAAGATTITVNTGLFAAGDTVFIQNLGAGACTVTAGTATVATAGSAILPQNDAGILYFTATGASIFYDFIQVGAASPLTTKGDLYTFSTSDTRLAVGATNGMVLTVDSAEATGLKYATPAGGGMTLLQTLTLTGASTTSSTFTPGDFVNYFIVLSQVFVSAFFSSLELRLNADTGSNYNRNTLSMNDSTVSCGLSTNASNIFLANIGELTGTNEKANGTMLISNINNTAQVCVQSTILTSLSIPSQRLSTTFASYNNSAAISSITFLAPAFNFSGGTAFIYGVK